MRLVSDTVNGIVFLSTSFTVVALLAHGADGNRFKEKHRGTEDAEDTEVD